MLDCTTAFAMASEPLIGTICACFVFNTVYQSSTMLIALTGHSTAQIPHPLQ
jgi:hypothetical protein